MHIQRIVATVFAASLTVIAASPSRAGTFLIDFSTLGGSASGWDVFGSLTQDASNPLTDQSGSGDDDVTLTALDDGFSGNNPAPPSSGTTYDGIDVPLEAIADYVFKTDDTAGTSARLRIDNLDAGPYNITVFEGRTTDASQFAKIWVGDTAGSGEPAAENTGSFAQAGATLSLDVGVGETLWYRHLEDNSGGISGMIINPIPEPASFVLMSLGALFALLRCRRAASRN